MPEVTAGMSMSSDTLAPPGMNLLRKKVHMGAPNMKKMVSSAPFPMEKLSNVITSLMMFLNSSFNKALFSLGWCFCKEVKTCQVGR